MLLALWLSTLVPTAVELPTPLFRLSFDHGLEPEIAQPGTVAEVHGEPRFVPGWKGEALYVPQGTRISFPAAGHLNSAGGTVACWVELGDQTGRPRYGRLFDMAGEGWGAFMILLPQNPHFYASIAIGQERYVPWMMGDATVRGEAWQHVALTWGPEGATWFVNGVTLCAGRDMPPFPNLPDRFYVGSSPRDGESLVAAMDDLVIYDRPLRSHELFALAEREPGLDLDAPNWLANGSFEVGKQPWSTYQWGDADCPIRIVEPGHTGERCFTFDRRHPAQPHWSSAWLIGPWLHLQRGLEVTLSATMKADRAGIPLTMDIQVGDEGRAVLGTPAGGVVAQTVRLGTDWARYAFTTTLPLSYKDGYRVRLHTDAKPCQVWIDDVRLAAGRAADWAPAGTVEIGLEPPGETALFDVTERPAPSLLAVAYTDPWRGTAHVQVDGRRWEVPLELRSGAPCRVSLDPIELRRGLTVVRAEAGGDAAELRLAATDLRRDRPAENGPFGTHGGGLEPMLRLGLTQFRDCSGANWRWIERQPGQWDWGGRVEGYATRYAAGQRICATVADAPGWASTGNADMVPDDPAEWERYCRRVMTEARDCVDIWEVWNEPDLKPTFQQDPARYAELVKIARRVQQEADPDAKLAILCPTPPHGKTLEWVERVLALGVLEACDLVAWHPYDHGQPEVSFLAQLQTIQALMDKYGGRKPLIFTEFGCAGVSDPSLWIPWAADGWRLYDENQQAGMLVRQCLLALWQGAVKLYWYQFNEERLQTGPDTFGLVRADSYGTPKPALLAYGHVARRLEHATLPPRRLELGDGIWALEFEVPGGAATVLWAPEGERSVPWPAGRQAFDLYGNLLPATARLTLGPDPVYLVPAAQP